MSGPHFPLNFPLKLKTARSTRIHFKRRRRSSLREARPSFVRSIATSRSIVPAHQADWRPPQHLCLWTACSKTHEHPLRESTLTRAQAGKQALHALRRHSLRAGRAPPDLLRTAQAPQPRRDGRPGPSALVPPAPGPANRPVRRLKPNRNAPSSSRSGRTTAPRRRGPTPSAPAEANLLRGLRPREGLALRRRQERRPPAGLRHGPAVHRSWRLSAPARSGAFRLSRLLWSRRPGVPPPSARQRYCRYWAALRNRWT